MTREELGIYALTLHGQVQPADSIAFDAVCASALSQTLGYAGADPETADIPGELAYCAAELAVYRFSLRGSEGVASESYSGVDQRMLQDIPPYILRRLNRLRSVRWG